jgi:hypothetical protein
MDGKELLWALRWIQSAAPVIALHGSCQDQEDGFVMSLSLDEPPEPRAWFLGRENGSRATLSFSLEDLAKRAEEAIRLLEGGDWAARRNQEGGLSADGRAALLRELLDRWRYGWQRRLPRKPFDAMAELLVGWEAVLSHRLGLPATIHPVRVTDVSISGYELRWTDNEAPIFFPGQIVAIRVGGDIRWVLALVRWLRQHPNGLQMGIQALGFDPEPVALGCSSNGFVGAQGAALAPAIGARLYEGDRLRSEIGRGQRAGRGEVAAAAGAFHPVRGADTRRRSVSVRGRSLHGGLISCFVGLRGGRIGFECMGPQA